MKFRSPLTFKEDKNPTTPPKGEVSLFLLSKQYSNDWDTYFTNPDALIADRGYEIVDEIRTDYTYNMCNSIRNYARLSTPWDIKPYSDDNIDKRIAECCKFILTHTKGSFRKVLEAIYSAQPYGFSVTEMNYEDILEGEWKGKIGIESFKTRFPHNIEFDLDPHGNINEIVQETGAGQYIPLPRNKIIHYVNNSIFGIPQGDPDVKYVYKPYISKKWALRFWSLGLQRFGMGWVAFTYPHNLPKRKETIAKQLAKIENAKGILLPDDVEMKFWEMSGSKGSPFAEALKEHNKAISRSLLLPDSLGYTDTAFGSYAKAKTEFSVFEILLEKYKKETEEEIAREQILKFIVLYNFGATANVPYFEFHPLTQEDKLELAQTYSQLTQSGFIHPTIEDENFARKFYGLPEIKEKTLIENKGIPEKKGVPENKEFQEGRKLEGFKHFKYKETETMLDTLESKAKTEMEETIGKMRRKFDSDIEKMGFLNVDKNPNPKKLKDISLSYLGDFKGTTYKYLALAYMNAKHTAYQEIKNSGNLPKALAEKYSEIEKFSMEASFGLSVDEAYKYFMGKIPITKNELEYYNTRAFTITGVLEEDILGEAQIILGKQYVRNDKVWVKKKLERLWEKYEATGELTDVGKLKTAHRLEIIRRTNMSEAMNHARYNMFTSPGVRQVLKGFQITAILDDRTTDYCSSIDGNVYKVFEFSPPPYHFQCRTTFVPVYYYEEVQFSPWVASPYEDFSEIEKLGFNGYLVDIAA